MQTSEVHDYASQLLKLHGDQAQVVASQKALEYEKCGDHQEAENWRRIRDTIVAMRGPHAS